MNLNKRERCINWENEEKRLLRDILQEYLHIIENKNLTTNTNKAKLNAWLEITERFNAANARCRDKKQLMNQWKVTKLNCKKEMSLARREKIKTGGGPKPPSPSSEAIEIAEMIPLELEVDSNDFDCDGAQQSRRNQGPSVENQGPSVEETPFPSTSHDVEYDFILDTELDDVPIPSSVATPKKSTIKTPTSKKKFNFPEESFKDMRGFRILENERLQKEHELRMQHMSEQHGQLMKNLKWQEEILKKKLFSE